MNYTLLRVDREGIVLCDYHLRRLGLAPSPRPSEPASAGFPSVAGVLQPPAVAAAAAAAAAAAEFARFARNAVPGVWALRADGLSIVTEPRGESRLADLIPTRLVVSPVAGLVGEQPKPGPGGIYDPVRAPGVATLLTTPDGAEILEACVAAVVGWDGARIVCVPRDRPRVWSCAEQAIREHLEHREAPLRVDAAEPLLLVNAVKGTCSLAAVGRPAFPAAARAAIDALFVSTARWP